MPEASTHQPFSAQLRTQRQRLGLRQEYVAERTRIPQGTYSEWERGTRLPSGSRERKADLRRLAQLLQLRPNDLFTAVEKQRKETRKVAPSSTRADEVSRFLRSTAYLAQQQDYLKATLSKLPNRSDWRLEVWLIGPETLPVASQRAVRDSWAENLQRAVNYKLIWLLDLLDPTEQRDAQRIVLEAMQDINARGALRGEVVHFPISGLCDNSQDYLRLRSEERAELLTNLELYDQLSASAPPASVFEQFRFLGDRRLRQQLLRYWNSLGTLAVFCAAQPATHTTRRSRFRAERSLIEAKACFAVPAAGGTLFKWLPDSQAATLQEIIIRLDRQLESGELVDAKELRSLLKHGSPARQTEPETRTF